MSAPAVQEVLPDAFAGYGLGSLREIPQPPERLWLAGNPPPHELTLLAVVGSRSYSTYGKHVVETLVSGLAGYPVGIVSGLARGIDALAHQAALSAGLYTLAVPGSGLDRSVLYPAQNRALAEQILDQGGGLLSELAPTTRAASWTFPQRNRLMAGMSVGTLLIEAAERSGTLITARLTVEYDRELLVVPGSIFAPQSAGVHQFLKLGATPVTSSADIARALGLPEQPERPSTPEAADLSDTERALLAHLTEPMDIDAIARASDTPASVVSTELMRLEIKGYVVISNGLYQRIV